MKMPGFTADASIYRSNRAYCSVPASTMASIDEASVQLAQSNDRIVLQVCTTPAFAACSFWLQSCFWGGGCGLARIFGGPAACTGCMNGCLIQINWLMFGVCSDCVSPGGSTCS